MPYLTLPCSADGPVITTRLSINRTSRESRIASGLPVPPSVSVRGLVDTGATFTCIDSSLIHRLGLSTTGTIGVLTPTTGAALQILDQYDVDLQFVGVSSNSLPLLEDFPVLEASLAAQNIELLIGRDILSRCLFIFDGFANTFSLAF